MSPLLELINKASDKDVQPNVSGILITHQIDLQWQFPVFASSLHFRRKHTLLSNVPSLDQASSSTECIFYLFSCGGLKMSL
jgi:hypothetical protein